MDKYNSASNIHIPSFRNNRARGNNSTLEIDRSNNRNASYDHLLGLDGVDNNNRFSRKNYPSNLDPIY